MSTCPYKRGRGSLYRFVEGVTRETAPWEQLYIGPASFSIPVAGADGRSEFELRSRNHFLPVVYFVLPRLRLGLVVNIVVNIVANTVVITYVYIVLPKLRLCLVVNIVVNIAVNTVVIASSGRTFYYFCFKITEGS